MQRFSSTRVRVKSSLLYPPSFSWKLAKKKDFVTGHEVYSSVGTPKPSLLTTCTTVSRSLSDGPKVRVETESDRHTGTPPINRIQKSETYP